MQRVLALLSRSGARYALLTTFDTAAEPTFANADMPCSSGGFRPQDLTRPPFALPPPRAFFPERYPPDPRVGLGLWELPFRREPAASAASRTRRTFRAM